MHMRIHCTSMPDSHPVEMGSTHQSSPAFDRCNSLLMSICSHSASVPDKLVSIQLGMQVCGSKPVQLLRLIGYALGGSRGACRHYADARAGSSLLHASLWCCC